LRSYRKFTPSPSTLLPILGDRHPSIIILLSYLLFSPLYFHLLFLILLLILTLSLPPSSSLSRLCYSPFTSILFYFPYPLFCIPLFSSVPFLSYPSLFFFTSSLSSLLFLTSPTLSTLSYYPCITPFSTSSILHSLFLFISSSFPALSCTIACILFFNIQLNTTTLQYTATHYTTLYCNMIF
jgi:hypothetical protein